LAEKWLISAYIATWAFNCYIFTKTLTKIFKIIYEKIDFPAWKKLISHFKKPLKSKKVGNRLKFSHLFLNLKLSSPRPPTILPAIQRKERLRKREKEGSHYFCVANGGMGGGGGGGSGANSNDSKII
jgi:hypothetical protein